MDRDRKIWWSACQPSSVLLPRLGEDAGVINEMKLLLGRRSLSINYLREVTRS